MLRAAEAAEAIKLNRLGCNLWAKLMLHALANGDFDEDSHVRESMYLCCGWLCRDFCFEGSCELCQCEVEAGAQELGSKAQRGMLHPCKSGCGMGQGDTTYVEHQNGYDAGNQELVRGCLTPIPSRQSGTLCVKVLSEEDVWAQGVL